MNQIFDQPAATKRKWAAIRIFLGLAQVMGAIVSAVCILQTGVNELSTWAVAITLLFTLTSLVLFKWRLSFKAMAMKKLAAEFLGTFSLVFAGTGAIVINDVSHGAITHVGIALTFGLVVLALIYALGDVSGAHFNPAVTIGFWTAGRFPASSVPAYLASQCGGALLASSLMRWLFPAHATLGTTEPAGPAWQSFVLEIILTWFLMLVILSISTGAKEKGITAGIAVGAVIALEALFAGPITGASMNPARSLAPALVSAQIGYLWIYLTAPVLGALVAVLSCRCVKEEDCCPITPKPPLPDSTRA